MSVPRSASSITSNTTGLVDGTGSQALFKNPMGITHAGGSDNALYVADAGNNAIRRVSLTGVVTTVAGGATAGSTDGVGTAGKFNLPRGITTAGAGGFSGPVETLFVADTLNDTIREITVTNTTPRTYTVITIAGAAGFPGGVDGSGTLARFSGPQGS